MGTPSSSVCGAIGLARCYLLKGLTSVRGFLAAVASDVRVGGARGVSSSLPDSDLRMELRDVIAGPAWQWSL